MDFHEGVVVAGRFRLVRMVGAGGMGEVWEADDAQAGRRVALKRLLPAAAQHHEVVLRFRREALILGRLGSEHVARVIDFIEDESFGLVLVMEFIEGPSLAQVLEERSFSIEEAIDLAHDLVKALVDLHEAKIVHRDLKPGNIILRPAHGDRFRAIIVDFGISRVLPGGSENEVTGITRANIALGTVEYMAPEQILNSRDVTPITDLYAVGVILFRAVKGQHAFGNRRGEELARAKLMEEAPPLEPGREDEIAEGLVRIVARALKKRPSQRFPSAREMLAELDALKSLADQVSDLDDTTTDGASTMVRRSPVEPPPSGKFPSRPPVRPAAGAPAAPRSPSSTQTVAARPPVPEPPPTRATAAPDPRLSHPDPIEARPPQASLPEVGAPVSGVHLGAHDPSGPSGEVSPVSVRRADEGRSSLPAIAPALPPGPLARAAPEPEAPAGLGRGLVTLVAITTLVIGIAIGLVIAPSAPAPAASACPSASAPVPMASAPAPLASPTAEAMASAAPAPTEEPEIDDMEIVTAQPVVAVAPKPAATPKPIDASTRPPATTTSAPTATAPTSTSAFTSTPPASTGTAGPPATSTATSTGAPPSTGTAPAPAPTPTPSPAPVAPIDSTL